MTSNSSAEPALLSISDVSRRTGIPVAGLRNWEQRYGLPRPQRSAGGQRRYRDSDCALLAEVLRGRASGLSLPAAMARALAGTEPEPSVFAGLRDRHPDLRVHVMPKKMLLALTWAVEDECSARAQRPVLVGSFQRERYWVAARRRWADLADGAEQTVVFADFPRSRQSGSLTEVAVPAGSPMRREWSLICDAPDHPGCMAGWERPGQEHRPDADRVFEAVWSVDPRVVRSAARIGIGLAAATAPELGIAAGPRLNEEADPSSPDLRRATGLLERTLDYLAQ
jgi:DICT domain-containing protein